MIRQSSYWMNHRTTTGGGYSSITATLPSPAYVGTRTLVAVRDYVAFIPSTAVLGMILLASICICATVIARTRAEVNKSASTYRQVASDVSAAKRTNAALRIDIDRVRFDAPTIEKLARQRLGMVKPGDIVVPAR